MGKTWEKGTVHPGIYQRVRRALSSATKTVSGVGYPGLRAVV